VIVTGGLQLSVAVAVPVLAGAFESPQASTLSGGQVMTGGVVSVTVTVCVQLLVFPQPSVAVQVRVIV
jgi:hypothetical protein